MYNRGSTQRRLVQCGPNCNGGNDSSHACACFIFHPGASKAARPPSAARARERVDAVVVLPLNKAGGEGGGCKGGLRRWGIVFWPWLVLATVVVLDVPLYQGWCVLSVNATGA